VYLKRAIEAINKLGLSFLTKIHTLIYRHNQTDKGHEMIQETEQTTEKQPEKPAVPVRKVDLCETICQEVMERLGKPPNFYRCTAKNITGTSNFRVNVWNSSTMGCGTITDSFFVKVNDEGVIVSPEIKKKYGK
tara:strand:- start:3019 stop:3420 length:402 start_codon:yes stop_codon:yes gene_type:complete